MKAAATSPYSDLLTAKRRRKTSMKGRDIVLESESDRSRLVFSAPFRRLQQKAQVFSLESNAAVRSRLTHSLEVAQVGRFIADRVSQWLIDQSFIRPDEARGYVTFVETACLMHDIGNPPFGHFGEAAIADWFGKNGANYLRKIIDPTTLESGLNLQQTLGDFLEFDGNSQGLRIVSLLQWNNDEYGLNLTYSTLAAYLKYLRSPKGTSAFLETGRFTKKAGFFSTEIHIVKELWTNFGYNPEQPQRYPLAYVMEAADDIAYCISDLEDSIEKGLLDHRIVFSELKSEWARQVKSKRLQNDVHMSNLSSILQIARNSKSSNSSAFTNFRIALSQLLTSAAAESYISRHQEILSGTCDGLIDESSACGQVLELLKNYCRKNVYSHYSVHKTELGGYAAIIGLLDNLGPLLGSSRDRFSCALDGKNKDSASKPIIVEKKLLALFPSKHKQAYKTALAKVDADRSASAIEKSLLEWNLRAHLITDYISGMTDDFALGTFQALTGIKTD